MTGGRAICLLFVVIFIYMSMLSRPCRDSDVYKGLQAAGLTNDDGTIKGIAFVDERSRRKGEVGQALDGEAIEGAKEIEYTSDEVVDSFGITKINDFIHVQKQVVQTLKDEGFFTDESGTSTTVTNADSGMQVEIGVKSIKETLNDSNYSYVGRELKIAKLATIRSIPSLIESGILSDDDVANHHKNNSTVKFAYIKSQITLNGKPAIITVAIKKSQQKNKFWVHTIDIKKDTGSHPAGTSKGSKTGYQTSDISRIVSQSAADVKSMDQTAQNMRSHEARPLTENEKKRLGWVCQRLNVDVDFDYQGVGDGVYLPAENGKRARISLSAAPLEPYKFVFKHELAHHLQTAKGYAQTRKALMNSPVFTDWLQQKYGGSVVQARMAVIERYRQQGINLDLTEATDELVADFFADCAFDGLDGEIDNQFLDRLATDEPNLFKRLWNAIKDLVEKLRGMFYFKDMSEVERRFEMLARQVQAGQTENTAKNGGARYSITESFADNNGNRYNNAVLLDTNFFDGLSPRNWGKKLKEFVYNRSVNQPFIMPIVDENGKAQQLQFAKKSDRVTKGDVSNHKVIDKLSSSHDNISKLAVVHIDEIVEIFEESNPYYTNEHNHQWLDESGWLHRNAYVINSKNGAIYNVTIDIAKSADGRTILYATDGKIKKVGNVQVSSLNIRGPGLNSNFNNSVPQNAAAVNNHSMQGNEKYSIPSDEGADAEGKQSAAQQTAADIVDAFNKGELDSEAALGKMADLFGRMKPGKKNNVDVVMPQSVDGQKKVRRLTQSIIETGLLPKSAAAN